MTSMMIFLREEKRLPPTVTWSNQGRSGVFQAIKTLEGNFFMDDNVEIKSGEVFRYQIINNWIAMISELEG